MTCDIVSYMVSYMNSYMDCDIISRHFLWHERFMNGSERFRTVLNAETNHCYVLAEFVLIYCAEIFVMQKYWSLGCVEEPLLLSAVALMYGPCLCTHLSSEIQCVFPFGFRYFIFAFVRAYT